MIETMLEAAAKTAGTEIGKEVITKGVPYALDTAGRWTKPRIKKLLIKRGAVDNQTLDEAVDNIYDTIVLVGGGTMIIGAIFAALAVKYKKQG